MGYDMRPASWGQHSLKVSSKLKPCKCGAEPLAGTDTAGMWDVTCFGCATVFNGDDGLGFEAWQSLVKSWNAKQDS